MTKGIIRSEKEEKAAENGDCYLGKDVSGS
jgi:hypothetical protein